MKSYLSHRNRSAFSLIELLVVLVIISIVSALVFPLYQSVQQSAKEVQCLANLRNFGSGLLAYAADHPGFPWWDGSNTESHTAGTSAAGSVRPQFEVWVRPYLHKVKSERLRCPLITAEERASSQYDYCFNYSGNGALCMYYPRLQGIPVPSSRVVFAAENIDHASFQNSVGFNMTMWGLSEAVATKAAAGALDGKAETRRPQYHGSRGARGLNLLFMDGHASLVRPAKGDWRAQPTFGTATNDGYFYESDQFKAMKGM